MIDLCTLGTGGTIPLPDRGLSSLYIRVGDRAMLIDCGEGTQVAIRRLGWGFRCIDGIFISHFHGDHCTGLAGLLLSMAKAGRTEPFHIWGAPGLERIVSGLCVVVPPLPFPLELHENGAPAYAFSLIGLNCTAFRLDHSTPCWGLVLELPRSPRFLPEKAAALGLPPLFWKQLQQGKAVVSSGRTITPEEVRGPERSGIRFLYATDTRPVPAIVEYGAGTDLMILEGMYPDASRMPQALKNRHMLFTEAAALARQAQTKRLLLTHFSNAVENPGELLEPSRAIFPNTDAAADLMTLTLHYPSEN